MIRHSESPQPVSQQPANPLVKRQARSPRGLMALTLCGAVMVGVATSLPGIASQQDNLRAARRVKVDFNQSDIADVAKALSIQSGLNVVLMPSVKGNVTVRLVDLSLEEALKRVAAAVGSEVRRVDDTFYLGSTLELRTMVGRTGEKEVLTLKFAPAQEVKELVQHAFPFLTVEATAKTNVLVLAGTRDDIEAGIKLARQADQSAEPAAPAPKVEPKPVMMKETYPVKFAESTTLVNALGKAVPELKVAAVERTLVLQGYPDAQMVAAKILAALDVAEARKRVVRAVTLKYLHPHQVSISLLRHFPQLVVQAGFEAYSPSRAVFRPLGLDTEKALSQSGLGQDNQGGGVSGQAGGGAGAAGAGGQGAGGIGSQAMAMDLNGPGFRSRVVILAGHPDEVEQATEVITSQDVKPDQVIIEARVVDLSPEASKQLGAIYEWSPFTLLERNANNKANQFGPWARAPFNWQVTVEAMETRRDARILAKPNIAVIDGEEASIFIGDILRYERLASVSALGQQFTIESVPVGVALLCRPRVNDGDNLTLRVHPVVSNVTSFTGRNRDIPVTSTREAESIIQMKNGETIAIGGLLKEDEVKILRQVPILGKIPFLGELFRHRSNSSKRSEVTIFLTARVQKPS